MWPPTRLIPWFSKTEGNTYATLLHHPFLFKGKPTHAQEVGRRISGAVAGEVFAQVKTYQVPITNSSPSHYIIFHLPLVFLSPHFTLVILFALSFPIFSLSLAFLCACVLDCLSRWLKIILNCVISPISTTMIFLALRLLLLPMLNLGKLMLLC